MPDSPCATELDRCIADLVRGELAGRPDGVGVLTAEAAWDGSGSCVTRVRPTAEGAAALALAHDGCVGGSTLSVTIGRTGFVLQPFDAAGLPYLREVVAAVLAGGVEEVSRRSSTYLRLHLGEGRVVVAGVPTTPWGRRRVHRYDAYDAG